MWNARNRGTSVHSLSTRLVYHIVRIVLGFVVVNHVSRAWFVWTKGGEHWVTDEI
jgi:hypothetical protein